VVTLRLRSVRVYHDDTDGRSVVGRQRAVGLDFPKRPPPCCEPFTARVRCTSESTTASAASRRLHRRLDHGRGHACGIVWPDAETDTSRRPAGGDQCSARATRLLRSKEAEAGCCRFATSRMDELRCAFVRGGRQSAARPTSKRSEPPVDDDSGRRAAIILFDTYHAPEPLTGSAKRMPSREGPGEG